MTKIAFKYFLITGETPLPALKHLLFKNESCQTEQYGGTVASVNQVSINPLAERSRSTKWELISSKMADPEIIFDLQYLVCALYSHKRTRQKVVFNLPLFPHHLAELQLD